MPRNTIVASLVVFGFAAAQATTLTTVIDDFSVGGTAQAAGSQAASSNATLPGFGRQIYAQYSNASVSINSQARTLSYTSDFWGTSHVTYSAVNPVNFTPGASTTANSYFKLTLDSSSAQSAFYVDVYDVQGNLAEWYQVFPAVTSGPVHYSMLLSDFTTVSVSPVDWSHISQVYFEIEDWTGPGLTTQFSGGFKVEATLAGPVPEPSTYGLALGGLALVGAVIRRKKISK